MGISIHFKGRMDVGYRDALCDELEDIAASAGFQESVPVNDDEKKLKGIILRPESEMESIPFLFDSQGRMHSLGDLLSGWDTNPILSIAVKTQFAEAKDHIWLIELLRYIQQKYIPDMTVYDEAEYWQNKDSQDLQRRMDRQGAMIKGFAEVFSDGAMDVVVDKMDPEALTDFVKRIAEEFKRRFSE